MLAANVEIVVHPAYGWLVEPMFNTKVWTLRSGHEDRDARNSLVRHRFMLPMRNIPNDEYLLNIKAAFLSTQGMRYSFLAKDETDYLALDEPFGVGDGVETVFQINKVSTFGPLSYERVITRPVGATVKVDGIAAAPTIDTATGLVEFAVPPAAAAVLTWSGQFRVPARFNSDALPMSIARPRAHQHGMDGTIELIEVFGE